MHKLTGISTVRFGEQKDGSLDARLSQPDSLLDQGHRQPGRSSIEGGFGDGYVSVGVAIGLDDCTHLGWGRDLAKSLDVVADGSEVHLDPRWSHRKRPIYRESARR